MSELKKGDGARDYLPVILSPEQMDQLLNGERIRLIFPRVEVSIQVNYQAPSFAIV